MNVLLILLAIIVITGANFALLIHILAEYNVFFTKVPEGEIVTITHSEQVHRFIGNIKGFWVHPKTGEVSGDTISTPRPSDLPNDLFGTGIYWLGIWPFAERHAYMFHWNKYAKKKDSEGHETSEYELIPREEEVSSIYFRAAYPVRISGGETSENVPVTLDILVTTETVNADTALFKVKSPGWLAALTGAATAVGRDFIGSKEVNTLVMLKSEIPGSGSAGKTEFQTAFDHLNHSGLGNPSIIEQFGQKITSVNFLGLTIDEPRNPTHQAAIEKYNAARKAEALIVTERGKADAAVETARGTRTAADAAAYEIEKKGTATAGAAEKLTRAVSSNPHAGSIALAEAIQKQTHASTLIIGQGVVPTKAIP